MSNGRRANHLEGRGSYPVGRNRRGHGQAKRDRFLKLCLLWRIMDTFLPVNRPVSVHHHLNRQAVCKYFAYPKALVFFINDHEQKKMNPSSNQ